MSKEATDISSAAGSKGTSPFRLPIFATFISLTNPSFFFLHTGLESAGGVAGALEKERQYRGVTEGEGGWSDSYLFWGWSAQVAHCFSLLFFLLQR